ncbi:hypothetical protein CLV51_10544 [Chitinophaga niastensis]|uniref:Condensin subunit MukE n=1 Tax=Chitinophaga niastensis TaxID=536980 RepID=A0A2P8HEM1_CHINA|nr:hypothetical protein [Chitinophaga niastensis]PSL44672.1 hypothetical protein CLV51_10544 [Chitinophaga niastensis]
MANYLAEEKSYEFLSSGKVEACFHELSDLLLSGKHIDEKYYAFFTLLRDEEAGFRDFFKHLYKLEFVHDVFDGTPCYYLNPIPGVRSNLVDKKSAGFLSSRETIYGLMLIDIYYLRYFDKVKIVVWEDLMHKILESEHQESYQTLLFSSVRDSYDEKEWNMVKSTFERVFKRFVTLGWLEQVEVEGKEWAYELRPALFRLAKLYELELNDFDKFCELYKPV